MLDPQWVKDHNTEAAEVWSAFKTRKPSRPPVFLGTSLQYFIHHDELNPAGKLDYEVYSTQAGVMLDFQLRTAAWRAEHIAPYCDDPVGLPPEWSVKVDLQTYDEAAYFGAPLYFLPGQVPDTQPILEGDRKNFLFDQGLPDPLTGGWYREAHRIYDEMMDLIRQNPDYLGRPIKMTPFGVWTEGPLTLAMALRGNELLTDLFDSPEYVQQLLDFIVEGTIARINAHQRFFNLPEHESEIFFADDALQLVSGKVLKEFLIPIYLKLIAGVSTGERVKMHLCGNATRHFKTLCDQIGVVEFETGFPVDFGALRNQLGSAVILQGGPTVMMLHDGTPKEVSAETRRILNSGVCGTGNFILREANNLAPRTPLANLDAMYQTARSWKVASSGLDLL